MFDLICLICLCVVIALGTSFDFLKFNIITTAEAGNNDQVEASTIISGH